MDLSGFDQNLPANASALPQDNSQAVQVMKKKQSGIGSWLPTIGSVALPVAAALLAPETGGLSLAALAAGGAVLGNAGKQKLNNEDLFSGNSIKSDIGQGAMGAIGQGVGGIIGKGLSKGAGALINAGKNYGTDLLTQVGGTVSPRAARAYGARATTDTLSNFGINPADHANVASQVTGQNGVINKIVQRAVGQAGPVDTTGISDMSKDLIGQDTRIGDTAGNKLQTFIDNSLNKINNVTNTTTAPLTKATAPSTTDIFNGGANPNDTLDLIRNLRGKASELVGKGKNPLTVSEESRGIADTYNKVADELEDRLFTGAGADNIVAKGAVSPQDVQDLLSINPGNKKWADFVQQVMHANTVGELRSLQAPFVKASQLAAEKATQSATYGATRSNLIKAGVSGAGLVAAPFTGGASLALPAIELGLGSDLGKTIVGNTLRKGAEVAGNIADNTVAKIAGQTAQNATGQAIVRGPVDFSNPNTAMATSSAGQPDFSNFEAVNNALINDQQTTGQPGITGYTDDELQQGIARAIGAGDIKSATEIQNLLKLNQSNKTGANAPLGQVQKRQLAQINTAIDRLQRVSQDYQSLNIGSGPMGLLKAKFETAKGKLGFNDSAKAYNDQLNDVAFEIARALSGGAGNISDARVKQIAQGLPSLNDTHGSAVNKINKLLNDLLSAQKEFVSVPSVGGDNVANPNDYTGSPQGFSSNPADVQFAQ